MNTLFGTDGIRGTANRYPIVPEVALKVGKSIARTLRPNQPKSRPKVVIGKDTRISGYMLETALTSGLVAMGMDVLLVGPMPTPAVAYLTRSMGCCAGIMLSASHNPYDDNGLKIFGDDGYKLSDELEAEIEKYILDDTVDNGVPCREIGKAFRLEDARGRYIEFVKNAVGALSFTGLRIVLDCANGAAYFLGPLIFEELGAEVISVAITPDGTNINEDCGALHPHHTARLVAEHGADIGIALDGDADRVIFCDHHGNVVSGDRVLCLCAKAMKAAGQLQGDTLVATVMSNMGMHEALRKDGIRVIATGVGDRQVIARMRQEGCNLGGENSGHIIFREHATTGDGIMSALKVLTLIKTTGARLSDLADCMDEFPQRLVNLAVRRKVPLENVAPLQEALRLCEAEFGQHGRHLLRYSGTENKLRILLECADASLLEKHAASLQRIAEEELGA